MKGEILILSLLMVFVLYSSGCIQPQDPICNPPYIMKGYGCCLDQNANSICDSDEQSPPPVQGQCPLSCDDGDLCTKDLCSASTNYECVNQIIIPCCGNGVCEASEDYLECEDDCSEPIEVGVPVSKEKIHNDAENYWTIFRREVYQEPPEEVMDSVITIPVEINERIGEISLEIDCNMNDTVLPRYVNFECSEPEDCSLAKNDSASDYYDIVRNLKKGDSVNALITLQAKFDDNPYSFRCTLDILGENPEQREFLNFQFTYNVYGI